MRRGTCLVVVRGRSKDDRTCARNVESSSRPKFSKEDVHHQLPEEQDRVIDQILGDRVLR